MKRKVRGGAKTNEQGSERKVRKGKGRRKKMEMDIKRYLLTLALWMKTSVQLASMARAFSKQVLHF